MKKHILLVVAVMSAFILKAGDKNLASHGGGGDSKLTIGISVGAALPMGDYAKKDTTGLASSSDTTKTSRGAGWANTGFHFDVTASYMFSDHIGAQLMIGGNLNSFDNATYMTAYGYKSPITYTQNNWYVGQYLVGPVLSFGDKLKINIRVLVGYVASGAPTATQSNGQSGSSGYSVTNTADGGGSGFGYNFGAGIKYNFTDKMGLLVNVDYLGSSLLYTGYKVSGNYYGFNVDGSHPTIKTAMALGILNASVGLAINL
ncbi:MAG TPA: hypothetical protein VNY36_08210 [Bacteroidia bacterium]|jgi:hypothetical protein|nr:hypothetical protein [Bacteroidia bacterium]